MLGFRNCMSNCSHADTGTCRSQDRAPQRQHGLILPLGCMQAGDAADVVARLEPLLLTDAVKGGLVRLGGQHVRGLQLLQVCSLVGLQAAIS